MAHETHSALPPGRLADRYVLGELLGQGSRSVVHRAHDQLLDRPAAVKTFPVDPVHERDVALLAALEHPHLVPVYDAGVHDDGAGPRAVVVMALCDGGSLADRLRSGPLPLVDALVATAAVADALDHAHRAGLAHLGVGAHNVLFDGDGRVRLADAGAAQLTRTEPLGDLPGPAGLRGAPDDVRALGLLLVAALTGRTDLAATATTPAAALGALGPAVPSDVRAVVAATLDDDPAARPLAGDVTVALRRAALAAEPSPTVPAPRRGGAPLMPRAVVVGACVGLSALLAGSVVFASTQLVGASDPAGTASGPRHLERAPHLDGPGPDGHPAAPAPAPLPAGPTTGILTGPDVAAVAGSGARSRLPRAGDGAGGTASGPAAGGSRDVGGSPSRGDPSAGPSSAPTSSSPTSSSSPGSSPTSSAPPSSHTTGPSHSAAASPAPSLEVPSVRVRIAVRL